MIPEQAAEERILVLAPLGRDAHVIEQVLGKDGVRCTLCADYRCMLNELEHAAAGALIAEEALVGTDLAPLVDWLARQPSWSDFPFVVLVSQQLMPLAAMARPAFKSLGNVVLLERPVNADTLRSAAASALRARRRQYQVRQVLEERAVSEDRLRESQDALLQLNATLEMRIEERTAALAQANDRLMREMNERERAQLALLQTQKMEALGHLTSGISHDFNNLLSVIQGNAELISMLSPDERLKRIASMIRKAAEQGSKLTGQLLTFSRGQRLDLKAIDLNQTLLGIRDLLISSLGSTVSIEFDLAPDIPPVRGDLNQIELSVLNLAINAKDAMPGGGAVIIRTERQSACGDLQPGRNYAVISVIDSGQGINPDIIGKVFDPFFTTKPLGKGTGLGLSQVYGIAQQSGGTAKIRSEVGVGTTVEIWLPCADVTEIMAYVPKENEVGGIPAKRARILVVEDDPQVRQFIVEGLEILGYQVAHVQDAQACLDMLETHSPDLLITDFLMPGMSGAELIKQARVKRPKLPAIMATGYADLDAVDAVIHSDMVLRKPFLLTDLAQKVQQALPT